MSGGDARGKIAILNQKGGVGKTTSRVNIGAGLAKSGKNVLVIDLDPQSHLTDGFGIQISEDQKTIYDLMKGDAMLKDIVVNNGSVKHLANRY